MLRNVLPWRKDAGSFHGEFGIANIDWSKVGIEGIGQIESFVEVENSGVRYSLNPPVYLVKLSLALPTDTAWATIWPIDKLSSDASLLFFYMNYWWTSDTALAIEEKKSCLISWHPPRTPTAPTEIVPRAPARSSGPCLMLKFIPALILSTVTVETRCSDQSYLPIRDFHELIKRLYRRINCSSFLKNIGRVEDIMMAWMGPSTLYHWS
jgi:hypothetical protein